MPTTDRTDKPRTFGLSAPDDCASRERRHFCSAASRALSLAAVAAAFGGCGGNPAGPSSSAPSLSTVNASVTGSTIRLAIDSSSPLAAIGSAALVQAAAGRYLVVRISQESFNAMTAICTH